MSQEHKNQVRYIATDNPSKQMWRETRQTFPNLFCLCLDPVHLPMVYEYSTFKRRTKGSCLLRAIMTKFSQRDPALTAQSWGEPYIGEDHSPTTPEETLYCDQISNLSMPVRRAERVLAGLDFSRPFYSRIEFAEALAALVSIHPDEVQRRVPGPNKNLNEILRSVTQ